MLTFPDKAVGDERKEVPGRRRLILDDRISVSGLSAKVRGLVRKNLFGTGSVGVAGSDLRPGRSCLGSSVSETDEKEISLWGKGDSRSSPRTSS